MTDKSQQQSHTAADGDLLPAAAGLAMAGGGFVPTGAPFTRDGQPVRRFLKDLIAVGQYRHPCKGWQLDVTPERMDRWVAAFRQMRSNGVDVEVVVDHRQDADATLGYLVDMFRWGDRLFGVHELAGERAVELAGRVRNVSVLIERDVVDGKGRHYGEAITHSSLVQRPIVSGQEGFLPIAAARAAVKEAPVLLLSTTETPAEEPALARLRELLELDAEASVDAVLAAAVERIEALVREKADLLAKLESGVRHEDHRLKALAAVEPEVLEGLAECAEDRLSSLVARGRVTPAVADALRGVLVGPAGRRNAYALSRSLSGSDPSLVRGVLSALEANQPVEFGEATGGQWVALAQVTPGEHPPSHRPETTREMIEMAGDRPQT